MYLLWRILETQEKVIKALDSIEKEMHEIESRLESMDNDQWG